MPWGFFNNRQRYMPNMPNMPFFGYQSGNQGYPQNPAMPFNRAMPMPPVQMNQTGQMNQPQPNPPQMPFETKPVDEKMMEDIKNEIEKNKQTEHFAFSSNNKAVLTELGIFAQNERNSSIFYKYLGNICNTKKHKKIINEISEDCDRAKKYYSEIYKNISGEDITINDSSVDNNVLFDEGILWALEEESKSMYKLSDIYEKMSDHMCKEKISFLLHKKVSRIGYLNLIIYSKEIH